jgi:hypothetical protein
MKLSLVTGSIGALILILSSGAANALPLKTWVSGVGNDANPCSRTAPCATFAGALAKTAASGEIDVLDPGDFGSVIIGKSISIINDGVGEAGLLNEDIVINAATSDVINLRGLVLNGTGGGGNGIVVNTALRVTIENCVIQQFSNVIVAQASNTMTLKIQDTTITNNAIGVYLAPDGAGPTLYASIDHSRMDNNTVGVRIDGTFGGNVLAGISDSP